MRSSSSPVEAYANGGIEALLPFLPPDVWTDTFDDFRIEFEEFQDHGSRVVLLGMFEGRIKASGEPLRQPVGAVFSAIKDGMIGEMRFFTTWAQALKAVGMEN